jgi:precorrin-3B synthase
MSAPIRGWCPGAHRPMQAADGLLVRIRPPLGRLTAAQAHGLATLTRQHGQERLTLTSRANLQWRGVAPETVPALLDGLAALGLLDETAAQERARNIVITPFRQEDDDTLAQSLTDALPDFPALPDKFGFAIDTGPHPVLSAAPADIRLERTPDGDLLVRADGAAQGQIVMATDAISCIRTLASWFLETGGAPDGRGRMRQHLAAGHHPPAATAAPATPAPPPAPGRHDSGLLAAFAFGELPAACLAQLADLVPEIRLTPWRMVLLPGLATLPDLPGLILDPASPFPRLFACTGVPGCASALAETRPLAQALAPHLPDGATLHVSGCAKHCAHPTPASVTLTATATGFTLTQHGAPTRTGLDPDALLRHPSQIFGRS